ncbi:MAG TPA: helix-turn-helix domain-containing protein [Chitinophagaceae bacterium]|nr:helix-turn-helix domain-containing protein [Chitinophagaceae bacterium]
MSSNIRIKKICQHCSKVFIAKTTVTQFCSDQCAKANYKKRMKEQKIDMSIRATRSQLMHDNDHAEDKKISIQQLKEFISLSELSAITGLSKRTLYRLMKDSKFPRLKIGKRLLLQKTDVLNYITFKYGNV